jgi:hypothetical protein
MRGRIRREEVEKKWISGDAPLLRGNYFAALSPAWQFRFHGG